MASVDLQNISKSFPEKPEKKRGLLPIFGRKAAPSVPKFSEAVSSFSLSVADGEFVVLVGPSGCGKSTTLRLIAGLERPDSGEILIDGIPVTDLEPKDRDIAMVFQNYALYPHMDVYENIAFALRQRIPSKEEIDSRVREAAALLELTPFLERKPAELSGGQRQRVAIGRAIVRQPKVMLMDEPLSNLDAALRTQMRAELVRLRGKIKTTFIYVTHDQTEAMTLGDRIVVMDRGIIRQVGTPQEILMHPANAFTAGFIGSPRMNFFDGELQPSAKGLCLMIRDKAFGLPAEKYPEAVTGPVRAGVRPEKIRLGNEGIETRVSFIEMTGSEYRIHLDCSGTEVTAALPELPEDLKPGSTVHFTFAPESVFLFDPESGKAL